MTITVAEYAQIVGVGRNTAYESARAGEVATIKVRGRVLVCVPPLLRKLGITAAESSKSEASKSAAA
jgi:hypothetical protein